MQSKMKKGEFSIDQLPEIILGVAATGVLILLAAVLLGGFDKGEETSKSYFKTFMKEVEKADKGEIGEFIMWQDAKDKSKRDAFLIYFGDKFKAEVSGMNFITYGSKNIFCFCYWDGETGECPIDSCTNMEYPIENDWTTEKNGQWFIGNGDGISIERDGEKYLVKKDYDYVVGSVGGDIWKDIKIGYMLECGGVKYRVSDIKDGYGEKVEDREYKQTAFFFCKVDDKTDCSNHLYVYLDQSLSKKGCSLVSTEIEETISGHIWKDVEPWDELRNDETMVEYTVASKTVNKDGTLNFDLTRLPDGSNTITGVSSNELLSKQRYSVVSFADTWGRMESGYVIKNYKGIEYEIVWVNKFNNNLEIFVELRRKDTDANMDEVLSFSCSELLSIEGYEVISKEPKEYADSIFKRDSWPEFNDYIEEIKEDANVVEVVETRVDDDGELFIYLDVVDTSFAGVAIDKARFYLDEDKDGLKIDISGYDDMYLYAFGAIAYPNVAQAINVKKVANELDNILQEYLSKKDGFKCSEIQGFCMDFLNGKEFLYYNGYRQDIVFVYSAGVRKIALMNPMLYYEKMGIATNEYIEVYDEYLDVEIEGSNGITLRELENYIIDENEIKRK